VNRELIDMVAAHGEATLAGSLLAAGSAPLVETARALTEVGAWSHVDVMDGIFTPHRGLPTATLRELAAAGCGPIDAHLMLADPEPVLASVLRHPPDRVTVHLESSGSPEAMARRIRDAGSSPWLAISPGTAYLGCVEHLDSFDGALVMLVSPGARGTAADLNLLAKVRQLQEHIPVGVDGGVTDGNAGRCLEAGARYLVSGRSLLG
jgi:ribulose-phosphate 3-epimerase